MSAAECARAGADLTAVVDRLGRTVGELRRLAGTSRDDFGGLSGEAFRQHASGSAEGVARLAARVALLAIGLVALGRELEVAERLRAEGRPAQARASEERAQDHWRAAVARYDGEPGSLTPVVPGPVVEPSSAPTLPDRCVDGAAPPAVLLPRDRPGADVVPPVGGRRGGHPSGPRRAGACPGLRAGGAGAGVRAGGVGAGVRAGGPEETGA